MTIESSLQEIDPDYKKPHCGFYRNDIYFKIHHYLYPNQLCSVPGCKAPWWCHPLNKNEEELMCGLTRNEINRNLSKHGCCLTCFSNKYVCSVGNHPLKNKIEEINENLINKTLKNKKINKNTKNNNDFSITSSISTSNSSPSTSPYTSSCYTPSSTSTPTYTPSSPSSMLSSLSLSLKLRENEKNLYQKIISRFKKYKLKKDDIEENNYDYENNIWIEERNRAKKIWIEDNNNYNNNNSNETKPNIDNKLIWIEERKRGRTKLNEDEEDIDNKKDKKLLSIQYYN